MDGDLEALRKLGFTGMDGSSTESGIGLSESDEVLQLLQDNPALSMLARKTGFFKNGQIVDMEKPRPGGLPLSTPGSPNSLMRRKNSVPDVSDAVAAQTLAALPSSPSKPPSSPSKSRSIPSATPKSPVKVLFEAAMETGDSDTSPSQKKKGRRRKIGDITPDYSAMASPSYGDELGDDDDDDTDKKKRRPRASKKVIEGQQDLADSKDKGKGLRHFSKAVCDKVMQKVSTTYNELADDIVADFLASGVEDGLDQKNIRRRVYDALNVLVAMGIISKEKKEYRWQGMPPLNVKDELQSLQDDRMGRLDRIKRKRQELQELEAEYNLYNRLINRNSSHPDYIGIQEKINLPFIIIHTKQDTTINCDMSEDRTEYFFDFTNPFSLHDDKEILRQVFASESVGGAEPIALPNANAPATIPKPTPAPTNSPKAAPSPIEDDDMDVDEPVTRGKAARGRGGARGRKKKTGAATGKRTARAKAAAAAAAAGMVVPSLDDDDDYM